MVDIDLRPLSDEGYIRFSIKAKDTPSNEAIHDSYRAFCKVHSKNDYTQGLNVLLKAYDYVANVNALWRAFEDLEEQVAVLSDKLEVEKKVAEPEGSAF